jgi:hypothetical protein
MNRLWCVVLVALGVCTTGTRGDEPVEIAGSEFVQGQLRATKRLLVTSIIPRLRAALPESDKVSFDGLRFRVVHAADINAWIEYESDTIVLPTGLLIAIDNGVTSLVTTRFIPLKAKYQQAYVEEMLAKYRATAGISEAMIYFGGFAEFAHISRSDWYKLAASTEFMDLHERMLGEALFCVFGHEVGHYMKGHGRRRNLSVEQRRQQEYEADKYSGMLLRNAGSSAFFSIPILQIFAGLESAEPGDHPKASCRVRRMILDELDECEHDPKFLLALKNSGNSVGQIRELMDQVPDDCSEGGPGSLE